MLPTFTSSSFLLGSKVALKHFLINHLMAILSAIVKIVAFSSFDCSKMLAFEANEDFVARGGVEAVAKATRQGKNLNLCLNLSENL